MKAIRLLATSLLVALCTGFYSCGKDYLDKSPETTVDTNTIYDGYINPENYDCLGGIQHNKDGRLLISGLKGKHLWFGVFEYGGSKAKLYEWIDQEATNRKQNLYIGYGEYKELSLYSIGLYELEEVVTSGFISRSLLRYGEKLEDSRIKWMLIFKSLNSVKKIYSDWVTSTKFEPIRQWHESSWIIDNCCYSSKGDTIFTPKIIPSANDNPVSYKEGIHIDGQTITRINYEDNNIIWKSEVTPPFQVASNCRYAFTLQDSSTSNWKYKVDVTYYDGTKKDFTFKVNIDNGKIVTDEIKVTGISINEQTVNLKQGETFQLIATVQPDNATNKNVTWSSSNETIASISKEGLVTALSTGETTITATTEDGSFSTTAIVTVSSNEEENKATLARLEGTWDMLKCYGWEYNDQNIKENWEESVAGEYIFFEDNDGNGGYYSGYQTYYFASSVDGDKLILRNSEWLYGKIITITKLTDTELHITATDADSEENYEMQKRGDGNQVITSSIVGTWTLITKRDQKATHVTYKNDGTFQYTSTGNTNYEEHGKYKIEGTNLYEMFSDEEDWISSKIILLNSITLTLQDLEDDGVTLYGKPYSYQRVN